MICKCCNEEKPEVEFYFNKDRNRRFSKCMECVKHSQKVIIKPKGFLRLSMDIQTAVKKELESGVKIKQVASQFDLCYVSLWGWIKKGQLV